MKADKSVERKGLINIPGREGKQGLTEEVQLKLGHPSSSSSSSSSSSLIVTVPGNELSTRSPLILIYPIKEIYLLSPFDR